MKKTVKNILIMCGLAALLFVLIFAGITLTRNIGKSSAVVDTENALKKLDKLYSKISVNTLEPKKATIDIDSSSKKDSLPDISKYPVSVKPSTNDFIEIFSSTEKSGEGKDGWLNEAAKRFNSSNTLVNGKKVSVKIRSIASGEAVDYIQTGKYLPHAFSPSNEMWGEMLKAGGVKISLLEKRIAGNVAGILLSKSKQDEIVQKYGSVNLQNVIEAVSNGELAMGYTNPFASSTGLNFLTCALDVFDSKNPLSKKAVSAFESFQNNIPFVSYSTIQMRDSAQSGVLDGFIMEYQTYSNSPDLKAQYVFTPFGMRHDNPVYEIGELSSMKKQILNKFIEFCKSSEIQSLASEYGFNNLDNYKYESKSFDGETIIAAQKLWKEKKNGSQNISAVFVADVSGSMDGEPMNKLKKSLLNGSKYIGSENSIGLVTFSDEVNIALPINKFDINQRALFTGAVQDMTASGNTAMFDAITVAMKMLMDEKAKNPNNKLMLFVLTDGESNKGLALDKIDDVLKVFKIPVYTIGYNADIAVLENLSAINEAASLNADTDDVVYKLENLFNAQM